MPDEAASSADVTKRGKWIRRLLVAAWCVLIALALAEPLLWLVGSWFVVDQRGSAQPTHVVLLDGFRADLHAARMASDDPGIRVLSVEKIPGRPMELGVLPKYEDFVRDQLVSMGVDPDRYTVVPIAHGRRDLWTDALAEWLDKHPEARLAVLCDRLSSRRHHRAIRSQLPSHANRIWLYPIRRTGADETNWWRSTGGVMEIFKQTMRTIHG